MIKLRSYFKTAGSNVKNMSFGLHRPENFNYISLHRPEESNLGASANLYKEMADSYMLEVELNDNYVGNIQKLKLTNQNVLTWEDYWVDANSDKIVDPKIEHINLQKNELIHANLNLRRDELKSLNLEGNKSLRAIFIHSAPKLELLNISNCKSLEVFNFGENKSMKALLAKNCYMPSVVMERLLRDFHPVITSNSNTPFSMFRKNYETVLDLRGNVIDWGNRRIASKIRLLLCNNWLVLWDNPPPVSIVPPQMYSFFTTNLEESLIKDYYG